MDRTAAEVKLFYFIFFYLIEILLRSLFSVRFFPVFLFSYGGTLILIFLLESSDRKTGLLKNKEHFGISIRQWLLSILFGGVVFFLSKYLTLFLLAFSEITVNSVTTSIELQSQQKNFLRQSLFFCQLVIFTPIYEEILFRYYLFGGINQIQRKLAVPLVTILFAAVHFSSIIRMIFSLFSGFFLTLAYGKTKRLSVTIIMHSVINVLGLCFPNFIDLRINYEWFRSVLPDF